MVDVILLACLLSGVPRGVCIAEIASGATVETFPARVEVPSWVTEGWIEHAAHIIASEARNVPSADIVVACTILRDILSDTNPAYRAWHLEHRWYGYGPPDAADRQAIRAALFTEACEDIPEYQYVGNIRDVYYWAAIGMIGEGPFDLYVGPTGSTVVGVPRAEGAKDANLQVQMPEL